MIEFEVVTYISASPERCFDLARSQTAHVKSAESTGEKILQGPDHDLLELGDEVTFEGKHLGWRFRLSATIAEMNRPGYFVDEMKSGPFRQLRHEHFFEAEGDGTRMTDRLRLTGPLGPLGWLAERLFLRRHLTKFLHMRGEWLKRMLEA